MSNQSSMGDQIRTFGTGATRDTDTGKLDYEAFLSPLALKRYGEYMHKHRKQPNGEMRPGDNWQKGIPIAQYVKSRFRHFMDTWALHRAGNDYTDQQEDNLCAEIFNAMGQLHEIRMYRIGKERVLREGDYYLDQIRTFGTGATRSTPNEIRKSPEGTYEDMYIYNAEAPGVYRIGPERCLCEGDYYLFDPAYGIGVGRASSSDAGELRRTATFLRSTIGASSPSNQAR